MIKPMDKKRIQSIKGRIKKYTASIGVMGEMILQIEIDQMTAEERKILQAVLLEGRIQVRYPYLDGAVAKDAAITA